MHLLFQNYDIFIFVKRIHEKFENDDIIVNDSWSKYGAIIMKSIINRDL